MSLQRQDKGCRLVLPAAWLEQNLLARAELEAEENNWKSMGMVFRLRQAA
jgi:hypothetical protein